MKKLLLIICLFSIVAAKADDNQALFEKGNKAYADKHFKEAGETYLKIIESGYESADLYYNLGNACYKQNDYPSAILYYEKAKKLSPADEDINFNIKVANTKIKDKIDEAQEFFLTKFFGHVTTLFFFETWATAGIVLLILSLGLISAYLFSRTIRIRKISFWLSGVLLFSSIVALVSAQVQYHNTVSSSEAIIFSPSVTAKSSPDESSTDLFVIHEGLKVKVLENNGDWCKIKLSNASVGWVTTSSLKEI